MVTGGEKAMSDYIRSNKGPGNIGALNPTIGYPQQPAAPRYSPYPAAPTPVMSTFPVYPKRGGLRGLMGLFGLGTEGTTPVWQRTWFPYAALGALGLGIFWVMRSKGGIPDESLFRNPSRGTPPDDAPQVVASLYSLMVRSAEDNGESARSVEWAKENGGGVWMVGDAKGRYGHIVVKPKGEIWTPYHRTAHGDRKLDARQAADLARDFFDRVPEDDDAD
jgi:hypothetical protein